MKVQSGATSFVVSLFFGGGGSLCEVCGEF